MGFWRGFRARQSPEVTRGRLWAVALAASLGSSLVGCHERPKDYQTQVQITRKTVVKRDEQKRALTGDVEFSYFDCPGDQVEVVRGGKDFYACMEKYEVGAKVPVRMTWSWNREGHYQWSVYEVGGCARPPDPLDEASFQMVQECEELFVNGASVGFRCNRVPQKALLDKCPWFRRH